MRQETIMKIYAIQTGSVAIKERQRKGVGHHTMRIVNTLIDHQWTPPLPILAWVIEHPEGLIFVDTGETSRTAEPGYFPAWHPAFRFGTRMNVQPEDEIGPQMHKIGLSPSDVRWVVMTHLHTDHSGGLSHFPKAEILVTRQEYAASQGFAGKLNGYLPNRLPTWFSPRLLDFEAKPYETFPSSIPLTKTGDVQLVSTIGHSKGHLSVIALEGDISYFLAGDTSYTEQLFLDQVVDGVSPDEVAAKETLNYILDYTQDHPTVYLPAHDPQSIERLHSHQIVHR
jgi:glyoxylase-like metal-dependent hydrolase (beta-lactamase superfamily II)